MAPIQKRRKPNTAATFKFKANKQGIEELTFDPEARKEYLTGFHKRKLQRIKHAQEDAAKQAKVEKVESRREMREERKKDLERHVAEVNALLRKHNPDISDSEEDEDDKASDDEWAGISESKTAEAAAAPPNPDGVDEYVDEDKFTTVTIETMSDDPRKWDGGAEDSDAETEEEEVTVVKEGQDADVKGAGEEAAGAVAGKKRVWTKEKPTWKDGDKAKSKKKTFRYESKFERQQGRQKIKSKNKSSAEARKANEAAAPRRKGPQKAKANAKAGKKR